MRFDPTITLGSIIVLVGIIASAYGLWIKMSMRIATVEKWIEESKITQKELSATLREVKDGLSFINGRLMK